MKRFVQQQDGVALVTSLVMTMISLTIVMAVMYMITQNIERTGSLKRYKTALEASYGGTDIIIKEIVPLVLQDFDSGTPIDHMETDYGAISLDISATAACLQDKLFKPTSSWASSCSQALNPKSAPDMSFRLQATGGQPYTIYAKIVDHVNEKGNSDLSGLQLEGAGVAESLAVITPQHIPYVYRLEVQAERSANATEQANMSVLYAW